MFMMSILRTIKYKMRIQEFIDLMHVASARLRRLIGLHTASFRTFEGLFRDKKGIEIGGPSWAFSSKGIFPVYPIIKHLDNCNFGRSTVWEGEIKEGQTFQFDRRKQVGRQYILEATAMGCLPSGFYDFVLASHILEHIANPILALSEWQRLLKEQGTLVMLLPLKDLIFDHRRPVTTMEHLIADYTCRVAEDDLTHMPEILALHDLERDPGAGSLADFEARSMRNHENRCFHHHVFDTKLAVCLMDYIGMQIKAIETIQSKHILIVAQKMLGRDKPNNIVYQ